MFQHLYLLGRSATRLPYASADCYCDVSTPLPSGKVCDAYLAYANGMAEYLGRFQHLYLLGRSATSSGMEAWRLLRGFQHLYLLGRSATSSLFPGQKLRMDRFNTFTFWEGLRPHYFVLGGFTAYPFQHLYLLGRSATSSSVERSCQYIGAFQHLYLLGRSATRR